jgi:hypothetical protein
MCCACRKRENTQAPLWHLKIDTRMWSIRHAYCCPPLVTGPQVGAPTFSTCVLVVYCLRTRCPSPFSACGQSRPPSTPPRLVSHQHKFVKHRNRKILGRFAKRVACDDSWEFANWPLCPLFGRISQIQKRPDRSRNAGRKTVTNPETLPQIQKRWGVVVTNPETDHKSRNVGRVTATNPEARPKKSCFVPDPLTS